MLSTSPLSVPYQLKIQSPIGSAMNQGPPRSQAASVRRARAMHRRPNAIDPLTAITYRV